MKEFLKKLINLIIELLVEDKKENEEIVIEDITTSVLDTQNETKQESDINTLETPKESTEVVENKSSEVIKEETTSSKTEQVEEEPKTTQKESYKMLTVKERQTYLKKIGLYTKSVDGIVGSGHKKAVKQFNIIFLNKKSETYYEDTDKLLRKIYASYSKSKYMVDTDWQYFKNFKKTEYKCKCGGKYCNGYPHKIAMHLVMADQYQRNYYGVSVSLTSGVRCEKHNKNVGGTSNSYHKKGRASDSITKGKSSTTVRNMIHKNSNTKLPFVSYSYDITNSSMHKTVSL